MSVPAQPPAKKTAGTINRNAPSSPCCRVTDSAETISPHTPIDESRTARMPAYRLSKSPDNIILSCQVKYILQGGIVKRCSSFDILSLPLVIDGEHLTFWYLGNYCRYHLVMPKVSREPLSMQDSAWCDYFRTSVIFKGYDNCNFIGVNIGLLNYLDRCYCLFLYIPICHVHL